MRAYFVPTRYMSHSTLDDGSLVLHSSRTGALGIVPPEEAPVARRALGRSARHAGPLTGILQDLFEGGFLVPDGTNEEALVEQQYVSKYTDDYLNLILLPTEQCNCRCVYCYQSFARGKMSAGLQDGIRRFILGQEALKRLDVQWFGGEPLVAPDVVVALSEFFAEHSRRAGISYSASMTTNGFLLTRDIAEAIVPLGVRHFQITLDGRREDHDKRRVLTGGGRTFDVILDNLRYMKSTDHIFSVVLRHNFDPESLPQLSDFIGLLRDEFGDDPRFMTLFAPIGQWGGPNDADLSVCEWRSATRELIRAKQLAIEAGFRSGVQVEQFQPNGYVCYAANPRSFVIGSDGRIYKCTVELDYHDRNIVGRLHSDGTMDLDWRKMALWCETNGLGPGQKCGTCFFRPTCHGSVCPKEWMDINDCKCPHERVAIQDVLPLFVRESALPEPPLASLGQCSRS